MCYENNSDISGVGVRVSFYLQTFVLVILVNRSWPDAPTALWTFISTSFGLTIAAVIQAAYKQLSLFQALQVSNLVWLANFGTFLALASYSRHKADDARANTGKPQSEANGGKKSQRADNLMKLAATSQTLFSMVLTLYVWVTAPTFGSQVQCTPDLKYVIFVFNVHAIGKGRKGVLGVTSLLTMVYIFVTLRELSFRLSHQRHKNKAQNSLPLPVTADGGLSDIPLSSPTASPTTPAIIVTIDSASDNARTTTELSDVPLVGNENNSQITIPVPTPTRRSSNGSAVAGTNTGVKHEKNARPRRPKRRRWFADLDPMFLGIATFEFILFTYFIVSGELLLERNQSQDGDVIGKWGFGQILALIVVIPSALALFNALQEHQLRRIYKRKRPRKDSRSHHMRNFSVA